MLFGIVHVERRRRGPLAMVAMMVVVVRGAESKEAKRGSGGD